MKLAEALLERSTLNKTIATVLSRVQDNLKVQEGDQPFDDPEQLLEEYERYRRRLLELTAQIDHTNVRTPVDEGQTLADLLRYREDLKQRIVDYKKIYDGLQIRQDRFSKTEIRFVRCLDPLKVQKRIDALSKEYRELDVRVQQCNWTTELLEETGSKTQKA